MPGCGSRDPCQQRPDGHDEGQDQTKEGAGQCQPAMGKLRKGRAGHHVPNAVQRPVVPQGSHVMGEGGQRVMGGAGMLQGAGQLAVVNDFALDGRKAAHGIQCLTPHQETTACCRGKVVVSGVGALERIDELEKVDECGDQQLAPDPAGIQPRHERNKGQAVRVGLTHHLVECRRPILDVRIGKENVVGLLRVGCGAFQSLCHGPYLAGPAGRKRRAGYGFDRHMIGGSAFRLRCRGIRALVVDDDDPQGAGKSLARQGRHCPGDRLRLIPGRDDDCHRTGHRGGRCRLRCKPYIRLPEIRPSPCQEKPCGQGKKGKGGQIQRDEIGQEGHGSVQCVLAGEKPISRLGIGCASGGGICPDYRGNRRKS